MEFPIITSNYGHVNSFCNTLAPVICNEWLRRRNKGDKTISPATVLAQAAKESGWNLDASTLFGIKGEGVTAMTTEYENGSYINVVDTFQAYPDITAAVVGYYDLMQWENYDDATSADTVEGELEGLTNDIGLKYATAPDYYQTTLDIINDFGFRVFNDYVRSINVEVAPEESPTNETPQSLDTPDKSVEEIADEIFLGLWGDGDERKNRLEASGYNYDECQKAMEAKYYTSPDEALSDFVADTSVNEDSAPTELYVGQPVRFIGSCDYNGVALDYTDRPYKIAEIEGDRVVLTIYDEVYAAVNISEVVPQ